MYGIGFDNKKYMTEQSSYIKERISKFGKLYLEFGGKLFDDYHASRVLPGFEPDGKIKMLSQLKDDVEILVVINANDIEKNKVRGDLGISYEDDALRLMDAFASFGFYVGGVVVTRYASQAGADRFIKKLNSLGVPVYRHYTIEGYPNDINTIVSEHGYGRNEYAATTRPLVVITAPGPGSGKMAVCLSQLYHEWKRGIKAGYAKFETFPVWSLPIDHPVNIAYEAATADLNDENVIDHYHLSAHGVMAVNYNRDMEIFPVVNAILERMMGVSPYKSPTDMGVNRIGSCIINDDEVRAASEREIMRRYYTALCDRARGDGSDAIVEKLTKLVRRLQLRPEEQPFVQAALRRAEVTGAPAAALQLADGRVATGKTSELMGCASALLLNALKMLAGINSDLELISPQFLTPICHLKTDHLGNKNARLHSDETLIALCMSAVTNPVAERAMEVLKDLEGCSAHFSVIPSSVDEALYRKIGVRLSYEPRYEKPEMYHK